ncbi:diguanylate cyclase domain-containing protein [Enterovibrio paralichthyis]|uniref:sensor domain-containing diguanylate cyclase n=1 Tax=Enterovibrio paralichthyis TaxID=2853805 RepID=UPI001C45F260|nr:diguanylate cyclase [Enterovibrio paralichthyis]MBV7296323.1 diguanylate cyclase [Enterovibrio paralichthyis]
MIFKWLSNLSLRVKLVIPTWVLMTSGIVILGALVNQAAEDRLEQDLLSRTKILANATALNLTAAVAFDDKMTARELLEALSADPDLIAARVVTNDTEVFARYLNMPEDCYIRLSGMTCQDTRFVTISRPIKLGPDELAHIEMFVSREAMEKERDIIGIYLIVGIAVLSVFSLLFGIMLHRIVSMPLASLHQSMSSMLRLGVFSRAIPVRHNDELGQLTACFNNLVADLTDRDYQLKQTLKRLENKSHYIGEVLDTMEHGVLVVAPNETVNYFNPAAKKLLGVIACDASNLKAVMAALVPVENVAALAYAIENQEVLRYTELQHPATGTIFLVSAQPMASEQHSLVQFDDVTGQREAERRRKLAELIFDKSQDATLVLSRSLEIKTQNAACLQLFGAHEYWKTLADGSSLTLRFSDFKNLYANGFWQGQRLFVTALGKEILCEVHVTTLTNPLGRIDGFVVTLVDQSAVLEIERLNHIASHDALTGLANRIRTHEKLSDDHEKGRDLHVLFIDLDGFKAVNDQFGHKVGDELLKVIAKRLKSNVSRRDFVARLSGDEFLIALVDAVDVKQPLQRLLESLSETIQINGCMPNVSASIGVRCWKADDSATLTEVIEQADRAMYEAKANGKNGYAFAPEGAECFIRSDAPELVD